MLLSLLSLLFSSSGMGMHPPLQTTATATAMRVVNAPSAWWPATSGILRRYASETMRAAVVSNVATAVGGSDFDMAVEKLRVPVPKRNEVLLRTKAVGVCHSDLHVLNRDIPFPVPAVLGHEVVGEVVALGPGLEGLENRLLGKLACGSFIMPCGECKQCELGKEEECEPFFEHNRAKGALYDGDTRLFRETGEPIAMYSMGGLAEYTVVPHRAVAAIPESITSTRDDAYISKMSIVGCSIFTAYGAVTNTAQFVRGESAAVIGVGGIGGSVVQILKDAGAKRIVAVDVEDAKLDLAMRLGATDAINSKNKEPKEVAEMISAAAADVGGIDCAFEALGRGSTVDTAILSVKPGGRVAIIGLANASEVGSFSITPLVRRQVKILGSYGARASVDLPAIIDLIAKGAIDVDTPVSRSFTLDDAGEAYAALQRGEISGRAIVTI